MESTGGLMDILIRKGCLAVNGDIAVQGSVGGL